MKTKKDSVTPKVTSDTTKPNGRASAIAKNIGAMYFHWTLDPIIELAYGVSKDFVLRPQAYQHIDIPEKLVDLRSWCGTDPKFPNADQRKEMNFVLFGRSDAWKPDSSPLPPFQQSRKQLL